tara:strand:- start:1000 stop:1392 length:393 start_codon:yes stop_codon:yes gene_type:complete
MDRSKKELEVDFTDQIKSLKESKARKDEYISEKDLVHSVATDVNVIRRVVERYGNDGQPAEAVTDDALDQSLVDSVNDYIFVSKDDAVAKAQSIGLKSAHAYKTHDGVVLFMPGRNTGEFYDWFWKSNSK